MRNAGNDRFEAYRQLCPVYGTSDHEASTGPLVQIMKRKFGSRIEEVDERLNEFLKLVRRYDEANGTDPVSYHVKKACNIAKTSEPLKTHLRMNVGKAGKLRWSARGDRRFLEEQTHLQDDIKHQKTR